MEPCEASPDREEATAGAAAAAAAQWRLSAAGQDLIEQLAQQLTLQLRDGEHLARFSADHQQRCEVLVRLVQNQYKQAASDYRKLTAENSELRSRAEVGGIGDYAVLPVGAGAHTAAGSGSSSRSSSPQCPVRVAAAAPRAAAAFLEEQPQLLPLSAEQLLDSSSSDGASRCSSLQLPEVDSLTAEMRLLAVSPQVISQRLHSPPPRATQVPLHGARVKSSTGESATTARIIANANSGGFVRSREAAQSFESTDDAESDGTPEVAPPHLDPSRRASTTSACSLASTLPVFEVCAAWNQVNVRRFSRISRFGRRGSTGEISPELLKRSFMGPSFEQRMQEAAANASEEDSSWYMERWEKLMMNPGAFSHIIWDFLGLLLIGYDCVTVPLETCFNPPQIHFMLLMSWVIRLFWTMNMVVSVFTGYMLPQGTVELRPLKVLRKYCYTWFPVDLVVVGFDWTELFIGGSSRTQRLGGAVRGLRMLRTVRILRLMRVPQIAKVFMEHIRSEEVLLGVAIAKIMVFMLLVAHFLACLWWGVGSWMDTGETWVKANNVTPGVTYENVTWGDIWIQYCWSIHWAFSQFSGEAFMVPQNETERVVTVIVLFFTFMVATSFVSSFTTAMTRIQLISNLQSTQLSALRHYLLDNSISRTLAVRVQRNALHAMALQKRNAPEGSIELLKIISEPLRIELHFEIYSRLLRTHPFFDHYNGVNPAGIRKLCHTCVSILSLSTGDVLFNECEESHEKRMFFVILGELEYAQHELQTSMVGPSEWLCEQLLWMQWMHVGTVTAMSDCRLLVLNAEQFQKIIKGFPTEHARVYAAAFVKRMNRHRAQDQLTEVGNVNERTLARRIRRIFQPCVDPKQLDGDSSESEGEMVEHQHDADKSPGRGSSSVNGSNFLKSFAMSPRSRSSRSDLSSPTVEAGSGPLRRLKIALARCRQRCFGSMVAPLRRSRGSIEVFQTEQWDPASNARGKSASGGASGGTASSIERPIFAPDPIMPSNCRGETVHNTSSTDDTSSATPRQRCVCHLQPTASGRDEHSVACPSLQLQELFPNSIFTAPSSPRAVSSVEAVAPTSKPADLEYGVDAEKKNSLCCPDHTGRFGKRPAELDVGSCWELPGRPGRGSLAVSSSAPPPGQG